MKTARTHFQWHNIIFMHIYMCAKDVCECLMLQLSTSCRMRSSGNHSLSMYGSSCGSPCLILHACRECHNTFTSHSSTSSQGQAGEESCFGASVNSYTVAPYICMHAGMDSIFLHACSSCLQTHLYACLFMFIHVWTRASPHTACWCAGEHCLYCSMRLSITFNLN